jgi:CheY-like chemotaxis protein
MSETPLLVFLAEDDKDDQDFFLEAISQLDIEVDLQVAENGELAIQKLVNHKTTPDYIFLDINMPIYNGLECLSIIKQNETIREIPTYIYTTYCSKKHQEDALKLGARSVILKPYTIRDLSNILREVFTSPGTIPGSGNVDQQ